MPKSNTKVKVTLNLRLGPVSPAAREMARRFWRKLISECKCELQAENGGRNGNVDS